MKVFLCLYQSAVFVGIVHGFSPNNGPIQSFLKYNRDLTMAFDTIVKVDSSHEAKCSLRHDKGYSLDNYMKLPVEQYVCIKMPLDATLDRMTDTADMFNLTVPPVTFFSLQVSPMIICKVYQTIDSVVIESKEVILRGSPIVVGLNGCYKIKIKTTFNWIDTPTKKSIYSTSDIFVEVEPPAPFKYFGRQVLEATGTLAMSIALRNIENEFVNNLARNYELWATDAQYRSIRAGGCVVDSSTRRTPINKNKSPDQISVDAPIKEIDTSAEKRILKSTTVAVEVIPAATSVLKSNAPNMPSTTAVDHSLVKDMQLQPFTNVAKSSSVTISSSVTTSASSSANSGTSKSSGFNSFSSLSFSSVLSSFLSAGSGTPAGRSDVDDDDVDIDGSSFDAPTVLTDDICLMPGEPVIRIEEAPNNARRIFTGIDIAAKVTDVWSVLTDYESLQKVIPSLVKNQVLYRTEQGGARLAQVGGAKVLPGVTFTAKTVLDVAVYLEDNPLPLSMTADHLDDSITDDTLVRDFDRVLPLKRDVFPRPYAITALPHRDITMQNVVGEGDFDFYQGIWRMQSLPNCAPDGTDACRLTYAVELRPKGFLPVKLIEGRIAMDLRQNLCAIRTYVENIKKKRLASVASAAAAVAVSQADSSLSQPSAAVAAAAVLSDSATLSLMERQDEETRVKLGAVLSAIKSSSDKIILNAADATSSVGSSTSSSPVEVVKTVTPSAGSSSSFSSLETAAAQSTGKLASGAESWTAKTEESTSRFSLRRYFGLTGLLGEPDDGRGVNAEGGSSSSAVDVDKMSVEELKKEYVRLKAENQRLNNQLLQKSDSDQQ